MAQVTATQLIRQLDLKRIIDEFVNLVIRLKSAIVSLDLFNNNNN